MSRVQTAAISDPGRKRRRNEDAYVCDPPLFAVADGMGGAQAGELASRLAAGALRGDDAQSVESGEQRVAALIQEANRRIFERASTDEAVYGMGTTMTIALLEDDTVRIGHVGDSRAYLIRDGRLEQLTEDHSLVAELVRAGRLSPEEAERHPQRSVITRVLGTEADVVVDTFSIAARDGDVFMLCSDGLTSMVDDATILAVVEGHREDLRGAATGLVDAANRAGGEDNITAVLFAVEEADADSLAPAGAQPDEERTLTELDAVPTITAFEPSEDGSRTAPSAPPAASVVRHRSRRPVVLVSVLVLLAVAGGLGLFALSRSHFVGAQPNGHIAVYQGLPWNLVGSLKLYRLRYESPLLAAHLSRQERRGLFDHDLESYNSALREVRAFERDIVP
jgi:protein phosphatase